MLSGEIIGAYSIVSFLAHAIIAFAYERGMIKLKKEKQKEEAAALKEKESNSAWKVVYEKYLNKINLKKSKFYVIHILVLSYKTILFKNEKLNNACNNMIIYIYIIHYASRIFDVKYNIPSLYLQHFIFLKTHSQQHFFL